MADVPSTLLRFFKTEEFAQQFVAGKIRFGLLEYYMGIEDSRRDDGEGRVSFEWNLKAPQVTIDIRTMQIIGHAQSDENIHYSGSSMNPYYIVCTAHPDANRSVLAEKYGEFVVCINNPLALLDRVKTAWQKHEWALGGSALIAPAVYNRDGLLEPDPYMTGPPHLSYSQKPVLLQEEREFRYVLECSFDSKRNLVDHLTLTLPDCSDLCFPMSSEIAKSRLTFRS